MEKSVKQEFSKLTEFDKRVYYQSQVKYLLEVVKKLRTGKELREKNIEIGMLTSERDEWKDRYESLVKKNIRKSQNKPVIGTAKTVIEQNQVIKSQRAEIANLQRRYKALQIAHHSTFGVICSL